MSTVFWHEKIYKSAAFLPRPFPYLWVEFGLFRGGGWGGSSEGVLGETLSALWSGLLIQRVSLVSNFNDIPSAYHSGCLETGFELGLSFDSHTSDSEKLSSPFSPPSAFDSPSSETLPPAVSVWVGRMVVE